MFRGFPETHARLHCFSITCLPTGDPSQQYLSSYFRFLSVTNHFPTLIFTCSGRRLFTFKRCYFSDISNICVHSNYNHVTLDYDIALLRLDSPLLAFNDTMSPVCLPTGLTSFLTGTYCWVTGFSKKRRTKRNTNLLRQAELPLQPLGYCKHQYPYHTITPRMLCAGFEDGGIDSCRGDSGGPLVCQETESGKFVQVGVVSWASACAQPGQPGVYTDVKYLLPWINRIIGYVS